MSLSTRGTAASQPLRADLDLFFAAVDNRYDATDNPDGVFTLCIAENGLCWPEMQAKLREIAAGPIPEWVPSYTSITGSPELKAAAAGFMTEFLSGVFHDPERVAAAAGAAAVIEMTALLLGDPGDVVVIPGPAYMAYTPDIGNIAGLERYDLHPLAPPTSPRTGGPAPISTRYALTTADLDRTLGKLGDRFRMLLLTQPNNPTGQVYSPTQLRDFSDWCDARKIHLAVNEIYALSVFDRQHPALKDDYDGQASFTSVLPLLEEKKSPYLHWWYAVSKDFGLSGLRLGLAYSYNEDYLDAWGNYGSGAMASNHTQWMLATVLGDHDWVRRYAATNRERLTTAYVSVVRMLRRHGIPYAAATGSLFVWLHLGRYLSANTEAAEVALWREIYEQTGILLTSPLGMGGRQRGWLRLVYSCVDEAALHAAMQRLSGWLDRKADQ